MGSDKMNFRALTVLLTLLLIASSVSAGWFDAFDDISDGIDRIMDEHEQMLEDIQDYVETYTGENRITYCPQDYVLQACTPLSADNSYLSEHQGMFQYGAFVLANPADAAQLFPAVAMDTPNTTVSNGVSFSENCPWYDSCEKTVTLTVECPAGHKMIGNSLEIHEITA